MVASSGEAGSQGYRETVGTGLQGYWVTAGAGVYGSNGRLGAGKWGYTEAMRVGKGMEIVYNGGDRLEVRHDRQ